MGFLARLRRDQRGNTIAMMAAMLIPLAGLTGSAIDMGRLYAVKSRLQQACDAGALAGRKMMTDTSNAPLESAAADAANKFFANNLSATVAQKNNTTLFQTSWFQLANLKFSAVKTSGSEVQGTASADVPMTIMRMVFASPTQNVKVTCTARFDVSDSDIMFVLDTTGSMACTASGTCAGGTGTYTRADGTTGYYDNEASGSKISGLRSAVLSFYDTLADAAKSDPTTHIRYGFVTYTSTVNVGQAVYDVAPSYLVTKWQYQSRWLNGDQNRQDQYNNDIAPTITAPTGVTQADCNAKAGRVPVTGYNTDGTATLITVAWAPAAGGTCTITSQPKMPQWNYGQHQWDVANYIKTYPNNNSVPDPTKITGATAKWQGCLEERPTTPGATSFVVEALPPDLDPDLVPAKDEDATGFPTDKDTRWRPMWPNVIYYRGSSMDAFTDSKPSYPNGNPPPPYGDNTSYASVFSVGNQANGRVTCGKPAVRLKTMARADVSNYVNAVDFKAIGSTYHDTGMIWGTRLISPTGIFASDTAAWPGRPAPNRYIVFMTDGEMAPNTQVYGMYGMEYYDKRITNGTYSQDTSDHNARFVSECAAAKARNITVFVVGFGQTLNAQLLACATTPSKAFYASDNASLTKAFQQIAQQVAMLRLSK